MGNTVTWESSEAHPTAGQDTAPDQPPDSNDSSSYTVLQEEVVAEQRRILLLIQSEQTRWITQRHSGFTAPRQGQQPEATPERERQREEENRERLETRAREREEARARQEREQELNAIQEQERLRHEEETRLTLQEIQRKAKEARDRQEREQQLRTIQLKERLRLVNRRLEVLAIEIQPKQARAEKRRKATEIRNKQERKQEPQDLQEQEELRLENFAELRYRHNSRQDCADPNCRRLHICRLFLADISKHGARCHYGHSLTAVPSQFDGAASPVSGAMNGAIPRHRSSGAGNQPSQPSQVPDGLSEELQCPVCLEMFCRATTLGCGHTFCADCLQDVRAKSGDKCPLCRAQISSTLRSIALDNIIRSMSARQ